LPDGDLEFIGRRDGQVKIRGYRVELGEVEHQILEHSGITDAVVLSRERSGDRYLACYYISGEGLAPGEIKEFLNGRLPAYMVPKEYMRMDTFPLTTNGKVDRRELEGLEPLRELGGASLSGATEERLAGIWSDILGTSPGEIGSDTNFFDLGGHSLSAISLRNRVNSEFDISLPLNEV
ncbi:non-ribosomal peptide synthetase, partial [Spongiimicrobium salis]|uniref:non-ribosomal peptide synthetase n=1 Tax=Spongiimicrobium salis TaxID=1667022 RepID=UPI00374CDB34